MPPPGLLQVELEVLVAGQRHVTSWPSDPGIITTFTWDGKDAYGRAVQGAQPVTVRIGHVFAGLALRPAALERSFGVASGEQLTGVAPVPEVVRWRTWRGTTGGFDARGLGLGGWTLSAQHVQDRTGRVLHLGTGERRSARNIGPGTTVAFPPPLTQGLHGVAAGPEGTVYASYRDQNRIYRLDRDNSLTLFIGAAGGGFAGDGGPAAQARVLGPTGLHVDSAGSLWIADRANQRLRCVDRAGIITTIAGKGTAGFSGDGGPATAAELRNPAAVAVGPDGTIYIADTDNHRVRRVSADGIITTFAGTGVAGKGAPGAPPAQVALNEPQGLAVGDDGAVYIAEFRNHRVLRVEDGIAALVMGGATYGTAGDGGPATQALLSGPSGLAFGPDGSLLIADQLNYCVRRVGTDGIASTVAGTKNAGQNGDLGLAAAKLMGYVFGLAASPDGSVLVADQGNVKVRRIAPVIPGVSLRANCDPATRGARDPVASSIGTLAHEFDARGRHWMTRDALTGSVLFTLEHDARGVLERLTDGDGNVTRVERGADGAPRAIIAPGGQRTALALDSDGFLSRVTGPDGAAWRFTYAAGGLLASATSPSGSVARYEYDELGRLTLAEGVGPNRLVLERREELRGSCIPMRDALGRTWEHFLERSPTGGERRLVIFPTGLRTEAAHHPDGSRRTSYPDFNSIVGRGTLVDILWEADPRLGVLAAFPGATTLGIPLIGPFSGSRIRSATQTDPQDPSSLVAQTDTIVRDGRTWRSEYLQATRTFTLTSPAGRRSVVKLDGQGRVIEEAIDGLAPVRCAYDAGGRWTRIAQGAGAEERAYSFAYDASGRLETVTDPLGRVTRLERDLAGRVLRKVLPGDRAVAFYPSEPGDLPVMVATPAGPTHSFLWTPDGRLLEHLPPAVDAGDPATRFVYDAAGKLTRLEQPGDDAIDLDRDAAGRLTSLAHSRGTITIEHDAVTGNPRAIRDPMAGLAFQLRGPVLDAETWSGPFSLWAGLAFQGSSLKVATTGIGGGNSVSYAFDLDNLTTQAFASTAHGNPLLAISRDPRHGLITRLTLGGIVETRTLNGFGEVVERLVTSSGTQVYRAALERDRLGRIVQAIETVGTVTAIFEYAYTTAGELERVLKDGAAQTTYAYDLNGNRTSLQSSAGLATAAFDAQDRLLQQGAISCAYTPAGELRRKSKPSGTTTYTHDALGRLLAVALPDGTRIDYLYDGRGRRIGKQANGVFEQGFLYRDPTRPCAEVGRGRGVATLFAHATEDRAPDFLIINAALPTGADHYLVKDHTGSVRLAITLQTGAVAQRIDYDAFGNITEDSNPALQPFGFLGGLHDRQTGLVRLGQRDYDPELGRFIARDPDIEPLLAGETNLYTLHGGDPVNAGASDLDVSSLGLFAWTAAASQQRLAPSRVVPFLPEGPDLPGFRFQGIQRTRIESRSFAADPQAVGSIDVPLPWTSRANP
jgi:RHS repeat-associated protein